MSKLFSKLVHTLGLVTKYDLNEYARRFLSGDDLPDEGDRFASPDSAMRISAVYACVTIRSQTIASLPIGIYERLSGGGQKEVPDHPVAQLLRAPNRYQTTYDWVRQQVACVDLRGNGISLKARENGKVVGLVPVHPSRVTLEEYADGVITYRVTMTDGRPLRLLSEDVLHFTGLATEGYWGLSPIAAARDAVSLARKIQKYGISILESGGAKRVLIKYPQGIQLTPESAKKLKESWRENGKDSANTAILDNGGDVTTVGMSADEAQYLETRRMSVADIARIYTVPLMLLGGDEKAATYASTEQFDLLFGKHTIRPICKHLEARIDRYLINDGAPGSGRYFCKFNMDALLRGDIKTRTEALWRQFQGGALSPDEWRELENRNPIAGGNGSIYWVPANMRPADQALASPVTPQDGAGTDEPDNGGTGGADNRERTVFEPLCRDVAERLVRAWRRGPSNCKTFDVFKDNQRRYAFRSILVLLEAASVEDPESCALAMATKMTSRLAPDVEIGWEDRVKEITASLMSVVTGDVCQSARFAAESVRAQRQAALLEDEVSDEDDG